MTTDAKDDDGAAVKPQVIDLQAEDVTVASETPEGDHEKPPTPPPTRRKSGGTLRWIVAALLAGTLVGGWLYRDLLSSYLPTNQTELLKRRVETVEAFTKTFAEQLAAVGAAADQARDLATAADGAAKQAATGVTALGSSIDGVTGRIVRSEEQLAALRTDLDALRNAVATGSAGSGGGTVDSAALAAIGQRLDALEKDVASLKSGTGGAGDAAAAIAALSQSLSDVKAKIAAGTSFHDEYDRLARMVPAAAGLDVLAAFAAQGLPNAEGLAAELRAAIPTLPKPEAVATSDSGGYWDSVWSAISSIVTIRTIGETDWPALAGDCAALAATGDLGQAVARIDDIEGAVPAVLAQWRERAASRSRLEAALVQLTESVQRQIVTMGGGQ